jgi:hypothetical protein
VSTSANCFIPEMSLSIAARVVAAMPDCLVDRFDMVNIEAVMEAMSPRSVAATSTSTRLNPFGLIGNVLRATLFKNWRIG